jgi:hypothetical protein
MNLVQPKNDKRQLTIDKALSVVNAQLSFVIWKLSAG